MAVVIRPENGEVLGSAFCIDTVGYFLTGHHVTTEKVDGRLTLLLNPGESNERRLSARIVLDDRERGLALLLTEKAVDQALSLGDDGRIRELMTLVAFGYPYASKNPDETFMPPDLNVKSARIRSLRHKSGSLQYIQVETDLHYSNAGGPLLDDDGRVVGVITREFLASNVGFATSTSVVRAFLRRPVPRVDFPETVPWAARYKPLRLGFAVDFLAGGALRDKPELVLNNGYEERVVTLKETDTGYFFEGSLFADQPSRIKLSVWLSSAVHTGFADNISLRASDRTYALSELKAYERGKGLLTLDGQTLPFEGVNETLTVYLAGNPVEIPMRKIDAFHIVPTAEPSLVTYRVSARMDDAPTAKQVGVIRFSDIPDWKATALITGHGPGAATPSHDVGPHTAFSGTIEQLMPAPITDVTPAGNGRYLLLHLDKIEQLAVFDITTLRDVAFIPMQEPKTLVAGGASAVVLALPEHYILQRWSLETFERELTRMVPLPGFALNLGMGYGATGPLLLRTRPERFISFLDLQTLDPIPELNNAAIEFAAAGQSMHFRFSADGRTIGSWRGYESNGQGVSILSGKKLTGKYSHEHFGYALPGPTGTYIYTREGVVAPDTARVAASPEKMMTFPSTLPNYFVGAERLSDDRDIPSPIRLSLFVQGSSRPIIKLPETPELYVDRSDKGAAVARMLHYDPRAKILLTFPIGENRVVARYVDLDARLEASGQDYFFVDSVPLRTTEKGSEYRYQVHVRSKAPIVRYVLIDGPEAMKINEDGLLSWNVPEDFAGQSNVILSLENSNGRELLHSFRIKVVP